MAVLPKAVQNFKAGAGLSLRLPLNTYQMVVLALKRGVFAGSPAANLRERREEEKRRRRERLGENA
ncbi:hypothetical protein QJS04_geneDACA014970 [Acorus gramineus]|uniref:Uncharacterized protein n=1 Tax=Acorus gramineus TaxID=55184 RepID=A0AAV9ANW7_ACOGR|nr:hypothetical protein QJS04_geneDACA014970 [Acorus gramineus]